MLGTACRLGSSQSSLTLRLRHDVANAGPQPAVGRGRRGRRALGWPHQPTHGPYLTRWTALNSSWSWSDLSPVLLGWGHGTNIRHPSPPSFPSSQPIFPSWFQAFTQPGFANSMGAEPSWPIHPCRPTSRRGQAPAFHGLSSSTLHNSRGQVPLSSSTLMEGCPPALEGSVKPCMEFSGCAP